MEEHSIPATMRSWLTGDVAVELAAVYGDQPVFPEEIVLYGPGNSEGFFADWPVPVLVISYENQGVCAWGVPIGDPDPPVLVSGEFPTGQGWTRRTVRYAPSVEGFVAARRWDRACLGREPLLQAQAAELDAASLRHLRGRFEELRLTAGWPGDVQYRFQDSDTRVMLWSDRSQCDWWVSAADSEVLQQVAEELMGLSDLKESFWSNDRAGSALLDNVRSRFRGSGR